MVVWMRFSTPTLHYYSFLVVMTLCNTCMLWMLVWNPGPFNKKVVGDYLFRTRCCPGCGFDLVPSPVEADGCTVCPECGAAWRLPYHDDPSKVPGA